MNAVDVKMCALIVLTHGLIVEMCAVNISFQVATNH